MSGLAVDTSVLLPIFKGEANGQSWLDCLQPASETKSLLVSSVVVSEIRSFFSSDTKCRKALLSLDLQCSDLTEEAAVLAGKIFHTYRMQDGSRKTIHPDFLIAAQADSLATEDRGYLEQFKVHDNIARKALIESQRGCCESQPYSTISSSFCDTTGAIP